MTTTEIFQNIPDFYLSRQECLTKNKNDEQTNPRYAYFTQSHFTAGDEEQFEYYRDAKNYSVCMEDIPLKYNIFKDHLLNEWFKYKDLDATAVINTFRYIFHKFKKGIFVKIANNKLVVFLPFSKSCYTNEWSKQINIDPKFKDLFSFLKYVSELGGYNFNSKSINTDIEQWYGNNCIIRYDMNKVGKYGKYYPTEGDTNIGTIKNMLETLCKERKLPDIEFFINRRDFPLLTKDGTEPYNNMWDTYDKPLISHNYSKYSPILSMSTSDKYADVAIPTYEDWARVQSLQNIWFPKSCADYNTNFNKDWHSKKPTAVFRGGSTGCGVTIETNPRLKLAYLSHITKPDDKGIPYLDSGITKWNLRPRKIHGEKYLKTIEINKLPFRKISFLTPLEQSNYKYIINVDGHVSAFRLSLELNMGSVILIIESNWKMWFKDMLIPYKHFVPVKSDMSDLIDQIKWCRNNDDKCQEIVANAQLFFNTYLQRDGIIDYMQKILINLKSEMGIYLYNNLDPLTILINNELTSFSYKFPETNKTINDIKKSPSIGRCYGKLQGIHWVINMILSSSNFENVAIKDNNYIFKNKLSTVTKWNIANFDFILKSTTDTQKKMEHIHDAYVGLNAINDLTKIIPNFAYIFGYYTSEDGRSNVIVEYIHGETLYDYIRSEYFKFDEYLLIIIQLCLALEVAQKKCALVHYDLTPWNIILQRIPGDPIKIDYVLSNDKILRIKTNIIPVIIDYGKSHVISNQEHHGFINMFGFNTFQDILTLLIKSIDQIVSIQLSQKDFQNLLYLSNFISGTEYKKDKFTNANSLRDFVKKTGKYSCLISDNKYDLYKLKPIDLITYIYKLKSEYSLLLNSFGNARGEIYQIMDKSNSRQVFDYILSNTVEEKLNSYINVFSRLKTSTLPLSDNLFLNYYAAQKLENNLLSVRDNMVYFLETESIVDDVKYHKIVTNTLNFIKKMYEQRINDVKNKSKNIKYTINDVFSIVSENPYTKETFLTPNIMFEYLKKYENVEINDVSEYKEIVENVLINTGTYKLCDEDIKYYLNIFSNLLKTSNTTMLNNNADIKTSRLLSLEIYSNDKQKLNGIILNDNNNCAKILEYLDIYDKILKML